MVHLISALSDLFGKPVGNGRFPAFAEILPALEKSSVPNRFIIPFFTLKWKLFLNFFFLYI
jgi:hypothetical protein